MPNEFQNFMQDALTEAQQAQKADEVPIGAVLVHQGKIIATGHNRTRRNNDPTAHAEILAIREACAKLENFRLEDCDLYVTLEPCPMCAGAISEARIKRLYFGAEDAKSGGVFHGARVFDHPQSHHKPEIYAGIGEKASQDLLQQFFSQKRK